MGPRRADVQSRGLSFPETGRGRGPSPRSLLVVERGRVHVDAVECKWSAVHFDAKALMAFRAAYPHGCNYLVTPPGSMTYVTGMDGLEVRVGPPEMLVPPQGPPGD